MTTLYLIRLCLYFICFGLSLYGLSAIDYNKYLHEKVDPRKAWVLYIILSCCLAYLLAQFLMGIMYSFRSLAPMGEQYSALYM